MDNIKDCTNKGECSHCGNCCGLFIPFNDEDIIRIKKYVKDHNIKPQKRLTDEGFEARCCFYDKNNKKCTIYEVRPWVCQDFKCDNKNWKKRRNEYELKNKYNSTLKEIILATFDDKVYGDYGPILRYIFSLCTENEKLDSNKLVETLIHINRLDLLNLLTGYDENNKPVTGEEMLKEYKSKHN